MIARRQEAIMLAHLEIFIFYSSVLSDYGYVSSHGHTGKEKPHLSVMRNGVFSFSS